MRALFLIFTLGLFSALSSIASAETGAVNQTISLYSAHVTYPAPAWIKLEKGSDVKTLLDQSEYFRNEDRDQFIMEQIPKGQSFENWSELYAVNAVRIAEAVNFSLDGFINGSFAPFIQYCGRAHFTLQPIKHEDDRMVALIFCENSPLAKEGSGYGDGIGEIALFHFQKVGQTYVKVYQEWKGKSFKLDDKASWPVSVDRLKIMAARFETIQIVPRKQ